ARMQRPPTRPARIGPAFPFVRVALWTCPSGRSATGTRGRVHRLPDPGLPEGRGGPAETDCLGGTSAGPLVRASLRLAGRGMAWGDACRHRSLPNRVMDLPRVRPGKPAVWLRDDLPAALLPSLQADHP